MYVCMYVCMYVWFEFKLHLVADVTLSNIILPNNLL